jgi:hypothetical protein
LREPARAALELRAHVDAPEVRDGHEREQRAGSERDRGEVREHLAAHREIEHVVHGRGGRRVRHDAPLREPPRARAGHGCYRHVLDEHLPADAPVAGAEREPRRELVRSAHRARDAQVREVRARDQQHEPRGHPHGAVEHLRFVAEEELGVRPHVGLDAAIGVGIRAREAARDRRELGLRAGHGGAVGKTRHDEEAGRRAIGRFSRARQRRPKILVLGKREALGHHADDRERGVLGLERLADDARAAAEAPLPETMAQDGHGRGVPRCVVRHEIAAERRLHAE